MREKLPDDRSEAAPQSLDGIGERKRIAAVFLSKPIIEALDEGHIQWAIRYLATVEEQLAAQGKWLDFSGCPGLMSETRSAYCRCLNSGLKSQAQALERAFEKYFALNESDAQ